MDIIIKELEAIESMVQVLYSIPDQSKGGSDCHMTRSANHRRHSVVI